MACNVFALMGLRQLYALLAGVLGRIVYLNTGLGLICALVGVKLLLRALHDSGVGLAADIPAWLSVLVVAGVLLATVGAGAGGRAGARTAGWPGRCSSAASPWSTPTGTESGSGMTAGC